MITRAIQDILNDWRDEMIDDHNCSFPFRRTAAIGGGLYCQIKQYFSMALFIYLGG